MHPHPLPKYAYKCMSFISNSAHAYHGRRTMRNVFIVFSPVRHRAMRVYMWSAWDSIEWVFGYSIRLVVKKSLWLNARIGWLKLICAQIRFGWIGFGGKSHTYIRTWCVLYMQHTSQVQWIGNEDWFAATSYLLCDTLWGRIDGKK